MSPDAQKKQMATEALRRREREYPIQREKILASVRTHLGDLSREQLAIAEELVQSTIIDIVPIEDLAAMVRNGGRIAHA